MKKPRFDRRTFLKSAVASSAAAVSVSMPQPGQAQQRPAPAANRMPYSGMPDARERADLIAYMLQAFK